MTTQRLPIDALRRRVRHQVERVLSGPPGPGRSGARGGPGSEEWFAAFAQPAGDPGFFGADSVTWRVHGDLPAMLVGGIAALLLQSLHPLAMAGVADHSAYRSDPMGRLRRTASFVGTTTFASTAAAEQAVRHVQAVHRRVHGVAPDGRWYDANDPDLLTWVQTAEAWCFVRAYRRYGPASLSGREVDRYYAEMATVAERLGARWLPVTRAEVRQYFDAMAPEMHAGSQALSAAAFIVSSGGQSLPVPPLVTEVSRALLVQAAVGILPDWARAMLQLRHPFAVERAAERASADAMLAFLRWAMGTSPALALARARCAGEAASLAA